MNISDVCRIQPNKSLMQNSLWRWDAHPELPELEPNQRIELGRFSGPGVVRTIHLTLNIQGGNRAELLRGVFLVAHYDGHEFASIDAPVGDFFCDSFAGESAPFAGLVMAKRPTNSLYCYAPMPFRREGVLSLVNRTDKRVMGYGYVTAETLPEWAPDLGYFHARWMNKTVRLPQDTVPLLNTKGRGHFFGCHLTAVSACPHFKGAEGICEGNDEFYIDGAIDPVCRYSYLGTEDFFGFSWCWRHLWHDNYAGTTYLSDQGGLTELACYRFLLNDPVRFSNSLKVQINYRHDANNPLLKLAREEGNGDVTFGIVSYWYQSVPVDVQSV